MKTTTNTGLTVDRLLAFLTSEKAAGRLEGASEVRIVTGWEGEEHLSSKVEVIAPTDEEAAYALLSSTEM